MFESNATLVSTCDEFVSRKKHTLRYNQSYNGKGVRVENIKVSMVRKCTNHGQSKEYAHTVVDDCLMELKECKLNSSLRWEEGLRVLENACIYKKQVYDSFTHGYQVHYDVPVDGHLIVFNDSTNDSKEVTVSESYKENWLLWRGNYYNPGHKFTTINYTTSNFKFYFIF